MTSDEVVMVEKTETGRIIHYISGRTKYEPSQSTVHRNKAKLIAYENNIMRGRLR